MGGVWIGVVGEDLEMKEVLEVVAGVEALVVEEVMVEDMKEMEWKRVEDTVVGEAAVDMIVMVGVKGQTLETENLEEDEALVGEEVVMGEEEEILNHQETLEAGPLEAVVEVEAFEVVDHLGATTVAILVVEETQRGSEVVHQSAVAGIKSIKIHPW